MPTNKRESLIFTVMMCTLMVLWMSIYNISLLEGGVSVDVIKQAWLGFPLAYIVAMSLDLFIVSKRAKEFAFKHLIKPTSSPARIGLSVSSCMVIPMVIMMSLYGALIACVNTGEWSALPIIWLMNIPLNFIMALPFQLLIAGPIVRKVFRTLFPEGTVLA